MEDSVLWGLRCFQWFKDTNLKANHNPEDVAEELKILETASQFNSMETIIKNSPYKDNVQEELARKKQDDKDEASNRAMPGFTFAE